jgi:hypothetical protein
VRVAQVQPPAFDLAADRLAGVVADGPAGADGAGFRRRRQPEIAASTATRIVKDRPVPRSASRACAIRDVDHGQRALERALADGLRRSCA